jgi:signal transduction histidine kinase
MTMTMTRMMTTTTTEPSPGGGVRRTLSGVRVRIAVGYLVLLMIALAVSVLVTRQVQHRRADREIEQEQAQETEELRRLATGVDPATGEPFGDDVEAIFTTYLGRNVPSDDEAFYTIVDGRPFAASTGAPPLFDDPQFLPAWRVGEPTVTTGTTDVAGVGEVRALAVPVMRAGEVAGVFVVASFPADDHREVEQVVRVVAVAGLVVLVVSTALVWSLAGRVLRPVRDLTTTARRITDSDLSRRIPVTGSDELAELGTTFNAMLDRLEEGFANQRQFLDDVAHELRTPITIVQGHVDLLGDDPDERAEAIAVINDELDRMNRYVNDLLVLAKAEHGDLLRLEPVDLGEFAASLRNRVDSLGDRRWVVDAAPPPGSIAIEADPGRLMQAMLNLATNAVQHTEPGAEIGVGAEADGHAGATRQVRLWVRDTGPGIPPEHIDQMFERRFRGAASRARRSEGMGIGLSIVDAIATAHGGSASARNEPVSGARFVITIPAGTDTDREVDP